MVKSWKLLVSFALRLKKSKSALEDVDLELYQQVINGEIEEIEALHKQGARLEWGDREGRTPLIVACSNAQLYDVAYTLIELGADINAYSPGAHGGTALHHAVEKGLEQTVKLLLSYGANALERNDDFQTPLEIARVKGHTNIVRTIEDHICFFSGWMLELCGPGVLDALVPQVLSRKIWVVVVPSCPCGTVEPHVLELAMYTSLQDCQPHASIALQDAQFKDSKLNQSTLLLTIFDNTTKTRYNLTSSDKNVKQQLQWLCNACRGTPQIVLDTPLPSTTEDVELAMAINDSHLNLEASPLEISGTTPIPSAPPVPEEADYGPIHYPFIDSSIVEWSMPNVHSEEGKENKVKENVASFSSCVVCLDAPVEGACVPCGHMIGCMPCLEEIKEKKGVCPICCRKIDQTIRLYAA